MEVWEDSRLSLQSVDSNSSSSGLSELSSEVSDCSDDSEERLLVTSEVVSATVESLPVPSMSANTIAITRDPINRETKTAMT